MWDFAFIPSHFILLDLAHCPGLQISLGCDSEPALCQWICRPFSPLHVSKQAATLLALYQLTLRVPHFFNPYFLFIAPPFHMSFYNLHSCLQSKNWVPWGIMNKDSEDLDASSNSTAVCCCFLNHLRSHSPLCGLDYSLCKTEKIMPVLLYSEDQITMYINMLWNNLKFCWSRG